MPILNGFEATERIRAMKGKSNERQSWKINGHIPIFAVSASLNESQYDFMRQLGIDGWILKPIDFPRMSKLLLEITDLAQRQSDLYSPDYDWEEGGWITEAVGR